MADLDTSKGTSEEKQSSLLRILRKFKPMEAINFNKEVLDKWWPLLKHLSSEAKLELVSRLINSLKSTNTPEEPEKEDWRKLYGAWADEKESAEELIELIRNSRSTNRQIESFD